jgi:hypothetical protein
MTPATKPPGTLLTPMNLDVYAKALAWVLRPTQNELLALVNTFILIDYHDILVHQQKEICHTMVVFM